MQALDPMEVALMRLMPTALSEAGQSDIEAMLDELAGPLAENAVPISKMSSTFRWIVAGGIAAAVAGLAAFSTTPDLVPQVSLVSSSTEVDRPGWELVSGSDRVQSVTDEGWLEDADGVAMLAMRINAVEENKVRDEESGIIVQISEPREEIFLMPITAF